MDRVQDLLEKIKALDDLCHCLDREFKHLQNWRHFAYSLGVPEDIIRTCSLYLEESPTIKLFEYLQVKQPQLTIQQLRHALKNISSPVIYNMIKEMESNGKVSEFITNSSSDILDQIALKLDSATKPLSSWKDLGRELGVRHDTLKLFEMYNNYNPTEALLRYLNATNENYVLLSLLMGYLQKMEREDVLTIVRDNTQTTDIDTLNAKDVFKPGSELLEKVCQRLNQDIAGVSGWRRLARHLIDDKLIDDENIISKLEPPDPISIHSPTKNIVEWIAANKQETNIQTLIEALHKIKRSDGVKILNAAFSREDVDLIVVDSLDNCDTDTSSGSLQKQQHAHLSIQETDSTIVANILQGGHYNFGIQSETIKFIGRASEKDTLREHLTQGEHQLVVLRGITGSGKTSLITVVAQDLIRDQYSVIYVNSRGINTVDHLAVKILTTCGFTDVDNPIPKVKRLFATLQCNCVLMIDNVDDMYHSASNETMNTLPDVASWKVEDIKEEFKLFIKDICSFSDSKKFKVLITSWEPIDYPSLTVKDQVLGEMMEQDCITLLQSQLADFKLSNDETDQLIRYCGGIPLLLCGAVKTIKILENVGDFCEILHSSPPNRRLEMFCPKSWLKDKNFSNCLGLYFKRMSRSTQLVLILLSTFPTVFTKKEVQEIVAEIQDIDPPQLDEGLLELKEYCFLSYDNTTRSYSLHSAIRDFGHKMTTESNGDFQPLYNRARQQFLYFTLNLLIDCEREFFSTNCRSALERYRSKLENVKQVVHWCITSNNDAAVSQVENACVNSFFDCAVLSNIVMTPKELKLLLCKMAQFCKSRGKTAHYFDCLVYGGVTNVRGCLCTPYICGVALDCALWCFGKAEEVLRSVGSTDMLRKEARAEFHIMYGKCMVRQGKKDEGLRQIHQGLDLLKCGSTSKEKVMLAAGYNELADAYSYCGQLAEALSTRQERALSTFQENLGIHPFTAKALSLSARDYHALGQYNKALEAVNKALFYQRKLLGDHQETARSYFDLGRFLSEQLQNIGSYRDDDELLQRLYQKALGYLQKALEIQQNILDSPEETAKTHQEIAVVLTQLGKTEDTEKQLQAIQDCMAKMETAHIGACD